MPSETIDLTFESGVATITLDTPERDAEGALRTGLLDFVFDDDAVSQQASDAARRVSQGPTKAYGELRRLFGRVPSTSFESQLEDEAQALTGAAGTADAREGLTAFGEKCRPVCMGR